MPLTYILWDYAMAKWRLDKFCRMIPFLLVKRLVALLASARSQDQSPYSVVSLVCSDFDESKKVCNFRYDYSRSSFNKIELAKRFRTGMVFSIHNSGWKALEVSEVRRQTLKGQHWDKWSKHSDLYMAYWFWKTFENLVSWWETWRSFAFRGSFSRPESRMSIKKKDIPCGLQSSQKESAWANLRQFLWSFLSNRSVFKIIQCYKPATTSLVARRPQMITFNILKPFLNIQKGFLRDDAFIEFYLQ